MDIILIASGPSARLIEKIDTSKFTIVTVNHGHLAYPAFDHWVRARDFKGTGPDSLDRAVDTSEYTRAQENFGGESQCGYSITLGSLYWCLYKLKPKNIYILGADMNYTPDDKGNTHIYGVGLDIQKTGVPDPIRMARYYKTGHETESEFLYNIYMRFYNIAKENGCNVWNASDAVDTKLPYPKKQLHGK